jgi:hypothetical protein
MELVANGFIRKLGQLPGRYGIDPDLFEIS